MNEAYEVNGNPVSADPEGGSGALCSAYMTMPHETPASPHDGRIYVEGEAHLECSGTPSDIYVNTFMGWVVTRSNDGVTTGYHLHGGPSTGCSSSRRCPRSGELVVPWGYETRCNSYGSYTAHIVVNYGYTYRGRSFSAQVEGPEISGGYGRTC